jgi:hypothetical protein
MTTNLERYFAGLALVVLLLLFANITFFSYQFATASSGHLDIANDMFLWNFVISAGYFFLYVILILANIDHFFEQGTATSKQFLFIFLFAIALALLTYEVVASHFRTSSIGSLVTVSTPAIALAVLAMLFDLSVGNAPPFRGWGPKAQATWQPVFKEAIKNDFAIVSCLAVLLFSSIIFEYASVDPKKSRDFAGIFIVSAEAYILCMGTALFTVESLSPYVQRFFSR